MEVNENIAYFKRKFRTILERSSFIFENTSFHGMKYVISSKRWYSKLFWIFVIFLCYLGLYQILTASIRSLNEQSISFTLETTYLGWNTTFPAVTVCELYNSEKIWDIATEIYGNNRNNQIDEFLGDVSFFYGTCFSCASICMLNNNSECPKNLTYIVEKFRAKCEEIFVECSWNNVIFDCCSNFLPLETEFGLCYSFNSKYTKSDHLHLKTSNQKQGVGILEINAAQDYEAFIHPPEDVPFINGELDMKSTILVEGAYSITFSTIEVTSDNDVEQVSPAVRNCRFPFEKPEELKAYSMYSYSSCIVQCHIDAQIRLCNCTHHLMPSPYKDRFCDISGLKCLSDNYSTLTALRAKESNKVGLDCDCQPACDEPEYSLIEYYTHDLPDGLKESKAKFVLSSLPTLRYNRKVMRTGLDLLVAIGSAFGLFFGASILSIVEVVYFLFLRKWN